MIWQLKVFYTIYQVPAYFWRMEPVLKFVKFQNSIPADIYANGRLWDYPYFKRKLQNNSNRCNKVISI